MLAAFWVIAAVAAAVGWWRWFRAVRRRQLERPAPTWERWPVHVLKHQPIGRDPGGLWYAFLLHVEGGRWEGYYTTSARGYSETLIDGADWWREYEAARAAYNALRAPAPEDATS